MPSFAIATVRLSDRPDVRSPCGFPVAAPPSYSWADRLRSATVVGRLLAPTLALVLAIPFATAATAADPDPAPAPALIAAPFTVPADELARLDALVAKAVTLGLPDLTGTTLHIGRLELSRPNPAGGDPEQRFYSGLHAKRADGTWIVNLLRPLPAPGSLSGGWTISESEMEPTTVAKLGERLQEQQRGAPPMDDFLKIYAPDARARVAAVMATMPAFQLMSAGGIGRQGNDGLVAVWGAFSVQLRQLGALQAEQGLGMAAVMLTQLPVAADWAGDPPPLSLLEYQGDPPPPQIEGDQRAPMDPVLALQRGLHRWFRLHLDGSIGEPTIALPADQAFAAAEAMLPPDQPRAKAVLAALHQRALLPEAAQAAPSGEVAARLAVWKAPNEDNPGMMPNDLMQMEVETPDGPPTGDPSLQRAKAAWKVRFIEGELPALWPLIGDSRPSRWLDQAAPRTIGDQALRAIAWAIQLDPRHLVGRDPAARWTEAERTATVEALRAWHQQHPAMTASAILGEVIGRLPLSVVQRLVEEAERAKRLPALLDQLAAAWTTPPAIPVDEQERLAEILLRGKDHPGLKTAVDGWPVSGPHRLFLAVRRLSLGDSAAYDAVIDAALDQPAAGEAPDFGRLLGCLTLHPRTVDVRRLLAILGQDPATPAASALMIGALLGNSGPEQRFLDPPREGPYEPAEQAKRSAVPMALYAHLLADERPAPASLSERVGREGRPQRMLPGMPPPKTVEPAEFAKDLRICDLAGYIADRRVWGLGMIADGEDASQIMPTLRIDLTMTKDLRDTALDLLRQRAAKRLPECLTAAGIALE